MVLDDIVFQPEVDKLLHQLRLDPTDDLCMEVHELAMQAAQVARPKALVKEVFVEDRGSETVTIDGITFTSAVLRKNLADVDRVFAYIATCGVELDTLRVKYQDPLLSYGLDCIKAAALRAARERLKSYITNQYGLGKIASMNPGSGDVGIWPIEQQAELFSLLGDVETLVGVRLTESYLMEPNKTISGIVFPTEKGFITCQLCHRDNCPGRQAPFDEQLWQEKRLQSMR